MLSQFAWWKCQSGKWYRKFILLKSISIFSIFSGSQYVKRSCNVQPCQKRQLYKVKKCWVWRNRLIWKFKYLVYCSVPQSCLTFHLAYKKWSFNSYHSFQKIINLILDLFQTHRLVHFLQMLVFCGTIPSWDKGDFYYSILVPCEISLMK